MIHNGVFGKWAYDDLNRLITVTDKKYPSPYKVIQYTYYEDGTRASMTTPESDVIEYTYDNAKRLLTVERNNTVAATYTYNALSPGDTHLASYTDILLI